MTTGASSLVGVGPFRFFAVLIIIKMQTPIIEHRIDIQKATEVYNRILDAIILTEAKRGEMIVALLTILGYQFGGDKIKQADMAQFIDDIIGWLNLRFMEPSDASH